MIVSVIVLLGLIFSILVTARLMRISFRIASIFTVLNVMIGLLIFSALTTIPQLSAQTLNALPPEWMVTFTPLIFMFELLSGTYLASRILNLDYLRYLKFTAALVLLTIAISVPLCLLACFLIS